jgi:DNA segregation ATPase FtsK/SpoIIIE, S-DNA-T family
MRKEIIGILLFFLVIFSLISLLSYHDQDPSIDNSVAATTVQNLFGAVGAQTAGLLVGLFGLGAFWVPVLLLMASVHFFSSQARMTILHICAGGFLLLLTTGCLLAFKQNHYELFGNKFSAGGYIGLPLKDFLIRYTNFTGGLIIVGLTWLIGFILATGFSLVAFSQRCMTAFTLFFNRLKTGLIKYRERRGKTKKRVRQIKARAEAGVPEVEIMAPVVAREIKKPPPPKQKLFDFMRDESGFTLPSIDFLDDPEERPVSINEENLRMQSKLLEKKLEDFGVHGQVVAVTPGPVITTFEYAPAAGVKINKIVNLSDDLALALRAISIRIVAPIPGKAVIGIEVPNSDRETVRFKEIVASAAFEKSKSMLTLCLGKDIVGHPVVAAMDKMPHLLIAGATGAGKSVALNTMICSILYKASPHEVKMIMVDPKRIELSAYDGIPHLITPVVTDAKKATNALYWAVKEMERRYELLSEKKARNIAQYNQKLERDSEDAKAARAAQAEGAPEPPRPLPYIVIIIDELADLMMVASRDVEVALTRLAQMARAAGIHLILATQRPSVDVLTGIIKANFPTRLTFQVSSKIDSRTIIDTNGAENLLGMGDMLFLPPGTGRLQRIHGAYISEAEFGRIIEFLKQQQTPDYDQNVVAAPSEEKGETEDKEYDERYDDAVALVARSGQASISMIQRHLRIGYNRAARIVEMMEQEGVVGPSDGVKPREVLVRNLDQP